MPGGRAGELDPARWSAVRSAGIDTAFGGGIGKAELPQCRPGLTGALVLPDGDTVICDPTATIPTRHLLTATAAQNYGLNTYRIRQPFDFAGRTGTIKLDVDLTNGGLHGWPAIAIAEDPSPTPSFDFPERGSGPRNGFEIEFMTGWCNTPNTVMPVIYRYRDYLESPAPETVPPASYDCGLPHWDGREGLAQPRRDLPDPDARRGLGVGRVARRRHLPELPAPVRRRSGPAVRARLRQLDRAQPRDDQIRRRPGVDPALGQRRLRRPGGRRLARGQRPRRAGADRRRRGAAHRLHRARRRERRVGERTDSRPSAWRARHRRGWRCRRSTRGSSGTA